MAGVPENVRLHARFEFRLRPAAKAGAAGVRCFAGLKSSFPLLKQGAPSWLLCWSNGANVGESAEAGGDLECRIRPAAEAGAGGVGFFAGLKSSSPC